MSGLFSSPKIPAPITPTAPTPAPTIDNARASQKMQDSVTNRSGRAASILTSSSGDLSAATTASKQLLGS